MAPPPRRHAVQLWPYAAAGLAGLRLRLPRLPVYLAHARAIAAELAKIDGVDVVPDPPQTPMMHIHIRTTPKAASNGFRHIAKNERIWAFGITVPTDLPGVRRSELSVGEATLAFAPSEVASLLRNLLPA